MKEAVGMGVMDKMMGSMMPKMMGKMFGDIKPEDFEKMMQGMHGMMENAFSNMDGEEIGSMIHEVMPNMMESCFSKMNEEQRNDMLKVCREMLDKIEKEYIR
ncbi:hypothetical protein ACFLTO_04330 [Chloroflexota bacterium]